MSKENIAVAISSMNTVNDCRKLFIDYIKDNGGMPVHIKLKCKCVREYKTFKLLPKRSVKCKHGGWFIKYIPTK